MNSIGSAATSGRSMSQATRRRHLVMLLVVAGIALGLLRSGHGGLGMPLGSVADLRAWLENSEPPVLAAALLRVLGLAGCAYLGCVLSLALIAEVLRSRGLAALSIRLTPALLRWCVMGSAGSVGLAFGTAVSSLPVAASSPASTTRLSEDQAGGSEQISQQIAVMVRLDDAADVLADPRVGTPEATMTKLDPSPSLPTNQSATAPPATPVASTARPQASEAPVVPQSAADDTWIVMPGDSFWSIAEEVLSETGEQPSEHAVAAYWQRLIAANRDRLAQPGNPDLLFAGQELTLPEP